MSEGDDTGGETFEPGRTTEQVSGTHSYDLERDAPSIVVVSGPEAGLHVDLDGAQTVVGRAKGVDVQIDDRGVSSRHLKLFERSSAIWVEDLESSNGTFVNGHRIDAPRELLEGDTIGIGRDTLICLTVGDEATDEQDRTMCVGRDANWFELSGNPPVDLRRRGTLRRVLEALVDAATEVAEGEEPPPLDVYELFEAGWPDQQEIDAESAAQRVYVTIRALRREGLSGVLITGDDGYYLAADMISIERVDSSAPPG